MREMLEAARALGIEVRIPQPVMDELEGQFERELVAAINGVRDALRRVNEAARTSLELPDTDRGLTSKVRRPSQSVLRGL